MKTKSLRKEHLAPDERFISRVSLLNPLELDDETRSGLTTAPHLPILDIPIFEPVTQPGFRIGLMAIDGCDVLFFDVQMGRNYYCNVANPGDPEVYNAMMAWHIGCPKAGWSVGSTETPASLESTSGDVVDDCVSRTKPGLQQTRNRPKDVYRRRPGCHFPDLRPELSL